MLALVGITRVVSSTFLLAFVLLLSLLIGKKLGFPLSLQGLSIFRQRSATEVKIHETVYKSYHSCQILRLGLQ